MAWLRKGFTAGAPPLCGGAAATAAGLGTKPLFQKTQSKQLTTQQLTPHTARTKAVHREHRTKRAEHRTKRARGRRGPRAARSGVGRGAPVGSYPTGGRGCGQPLRGTNGPPRSAKRRWEGGPAESHSAGGGAAARPSRNTAAAVSPSEEQTGPPRGSYSALGALFGQQAHVDHELA